MSDAIIAGKQITPIRSAYRLKGLARKRKPMILLTSNDKTENNRGIRGTTFPISVNAS
jgi:hypothetical protein